MRKTKIICTLGPATDDPEVLKRIFLTGMDVARLNFSHGTHEEHLARIECFKKVRAELGRPAALLLDTKGPEIRLRTFKNGEVELKEGDKFIINIEVTFKTLDKEFVIEKLENLLKQVVLDIIEDSKRYKK